MSGSESSNIPDRSRRLLSVGLFLLGVIPPMIMGIYFLPDRLLAALSLPSWVCLILATVFIGLSRISPMATRWLLFAAIAPLVGIAFFVTIVLIIIGAPLVAGIPLYMVRALQHLGARFPTFEPGRAPTVAYTSIVLVYIAIMVVGGEPHDRYVVGPFLMVAIGSFLQLLYRVHRASALAPVEDEEVELPPEPQTLTSRGQR